LPIVRTSPAHGTAYELVGQDKASEASFRQALYLACDIFKNRMEYKQLTSNPMKTIDVTNV
jgi:4-hydroxythreonine-4-phosphate dehydrogenase